MKNVKNVLNLGITRKGAKPSTFNVENFLVLCTLLIWFFIDIKLYNKNDCIPTFRLECSRFFIWAVFLQLL